MMFADLDAVSKYSNVGEERSGRFPHLACTWPSTPEWLDQDTLPFEEDIPFLHLYSTTEKAIRDGWASEWWTALCATTGLLSL